MGNSEVTFDAQNCYCHPKSSEQEFGAYCLDIGRDHYAVCALHNTFRWVGSNLHSFWREMTDEDFRQNAFRLLAMKPLGRLEAEWQTRAKKLIGETPNRGH
jgi:hypothetical protein